MNRKQVRAHYLKHSEEEGGHAYWLGAHSVRWQEENNRVYDPRTLIWELHNKRKLSRGVRLQCICGEEGCIAPDHQREVSRAAHLRNQPVEKETS